MIQSKLAKNKNLLLLALIFFLGAFVRFYNVSNVPVSLYWDEVASTYNAYSITLTGRDEYGDSFPLLFRSFEDYKTPANIYLTAIVVKFFGLSELTARFTSAFFGSLSVIVCFFLAKGLFKKQKFKSDFLNPSMIGLISAFLLSISPWHIQFSRTGFEANVGLFFVLLAAYLFFRFTNSQVFKFLYFSMAIFSISIYFYRSIWLFSPLLIFSLLIINRDILRKELAKTLSALLLFLLILAPFLPWALSNEGFTRQRQVNVFSNSGELVYEASVKQEEAGSDTLSKIVYNRRIVYFKAVLERYLGHFSPKFLFFEGDGNPRHGVLGLGLMYLWELPFLIIGAYILFKFSSKVRNSLILWILIAPIASAFAVPSPHALRSLNMLPVPQILVGIGIMFAYSYVKRNFRFLYIFVISALIIVFSARYFDLYYSQANRVSSEWADGYKQLTEFVFKEEGKYDKVVISGHWWQPYIYFLFYKQYDPKLFQEQGNKSGFDKYIFGGTSWDMQGRELGDLNLEKLTGTRNILIALSPAEYELQKENVKTIDVIQNHNNETVFILGELK